MGAFGILITNDFKALEGDRKLGVRSLPVQMGVQSAARFAVAVMVVPQVAVLGLLLYWDRPIHAVTIGLFVVAQLILGRRFVSDPQGRDVWFNARGIPLSVLGMMIAAFAVRAL